MREFFPDILGGKQNRTFGTGKLKLCGSSGRVNVARIFFGALEAFKQSEDVLGLAFEFGGVAARCCCLVSAPSGLITMIT